MIGPFANSAGIVAGALIGTFWGGRLTESSRTNINSVFGCLALGIGVTLCSRGSSLPPVIVSLLFGAIIGEALGIERNVMKLAFKAVSLFSRKKKDSQGLGTKAFVDQFSVITVLFCASSLGMMGPIHEGLSGDPSLLMVKALLDFFTAMVFAANIGAVAGVLALPQLGLQLALLFSATAISPLTTPAMFANFSACGGIIMLGTGLRQCGLVQVPILNMLPGLALVMPVTALWARLAV